LPPPMKLEVRECGTVTTYFVSTVYTIQGLTAGLAIKLDNGTSLFNGIRCWEVLDPAATQVDYSNLTSNGIYQNCASCLPVTSTTTTTTTLPTYWYELTSCINGTITNSTGYYGGGFTVGQIVYMTVAPTVYFIITASSTTAPVGPQNDITASGLTACPTTSTTTTTTTIAPLVVTNGAVTCSGGSGSFTSTFSGGTPPYLYTAADTSQVNLSLKLGGSIPGRLNVTGNSQLFNLTPGSYYVGVVDSNNDTTINLIPVNVNGCITSTTTTTTTLPTYWYRMTSCTNGDILNSIAYYGGGFSVNDIVSIGGGQYALITNALTDAPAGALIPITATALTSCPTTTTTTTTAAPLPPVAFTYSTSCAGGEGTGVITITSITGGTGTGYQYSIQPTPGIWYDYPATNQLTGLANSTYSVAVRDSVGAGTSQFVGISCVNTTTTTTTTEAPRYRYELYNLDVDCNLLFPATLAWSYENVGTGYYSINGLPVCYLIVASHTDNTQQLVNIVSSSCTAPTTTTTTTPAPSNCTLWNFDNFSSEFGNNVDYTDCSGALTSVYVPELSSVQRCVQNGTTPVPGDTYIIVTNTLDPCI